MYYKISDFANKIGVTTTTVRNWDRLNVLKPDHVVNTYRYYSDEQVDFVLSGKFKETRPHPYSKYKDKQKVKKTHDTDIRQVDEVSEDS